MSKKEVHDDQEQERTKALKRHHKEPRNQDDIDEDEEEYSHLIR